MCSPQRHGRQGSALHGASLLAVHTLGDNDMLGDTAADGSKREKDNTEDLKNFFWFNLI